MSDTETIITEDTNPQAEIYFLVARFLESGPCSEAFRAFKREIEENELLPRRIDWQGRDHMSSYRELVDQNRHIGGDNLLRICHSLSGYVNEALPPIVGGVQSFLGAGRQSLLRTRIDVEKVKWNTAHHSVVKYSKPLRPPRSLAYPTNICRIQNAKTASGVHSNTLLPTALYDNFMLKSRKLGHLAAVYCLMFDRSGKFIITGADDQLVKIWRLSDSRLMATLRGHASEIADMAMSHDNRMLAAGSCDKIVRVWCTRTTSPIAVLVGHTAMITSVQFCPLVHSEVSYLLSTANDGCVCFWVYCKKTCKFLPKPKKFIERSCAGARMICSSFSSGGNYLTTGSSDHVIRIYSFSGTTPGKVCELEKHTDRVDSIEYSHTGHSFASGSHDGTAVIWRYERQEWRATLLDMTQGKHAITTEEKHVTMVGWSADDSHVVTAASDYSIRVWESTHGTLVHVLKGHKDNAYVISASPIDPRIIATAGHDGYIILWDIIQGVQIQSHFNMIEGQGHGAVFDSRFSPDGLSLAATDSHGFLLILGFGTSDRYNKVPAELFFHTDYRPLIRDTNNYVIDGQSQQPPHLMPPAFLVNMDGIPYPPDNQRLVPGRENMTRAQLVPRMAYNEEGDEEVAGDENPEEGEISVQEVAPEQDSRGEEIDYLIEHLQREQDQRIAAEGGDALPVPQSHSTPEAANPNRGVGLLLSGQLEGVRQSLESMDQLPQPANNDDDDVGILTSRITIPPLSHKIIQKLKEQRSAYGEVEQNYFACEGKKKPLIFRSESSDSSSYVIKTRHHRQARRDRHPSNEEGQESVLNRLTTRALYDTDVEETTQSDSNNGRRNRAARGSETEDYSDWMGDQDDEVMEPPTRSSRRHRHTRRRRTRATHRLSSGSEIDLDELDDLDDVQEVRPRRPRKAKKPKVKKKRRERNDSPPCQPIDVRPDILPSEADTSINADTTHPDSSIQLPPVDPEIIEKYRPPEWLTDVIPRKAPYMPQMGDDVVYFRQGHELYVQAMGDDVVYFRQGHELYVHAVRNRDVYKIHESGHPWVKLPHLSEHAYMRVVGIKVEIGPPRLCCLKLNFVNPDTRKVVPGSFTVKYHDMADVIDFIVLKQIYDVAMKRDWKPGERFRSVIDDSWWMGTVVTHEPLHSDFPDSQFQCFNVHWDNGEKEKLSPWDMEPIVDEGATDGERVSNEELALLLYTPLKSEWLGATDGERVSNEELALLLYTPVKSEWPRGDRDGESERISIGLSHIMEHSIAEEFLIPVPTYYQIIP